jgi:phosphatidylserine/phosphatidylglycerophosphate/cardiolipin synthase-like enzyme
MMIRLSLVKNAGLLFLLAVLSCPVLAYQAPQPNIQGNAAAYVEVAFTPGQDAAGLIIAAIDKARSQILVQAFSFTHDGIARALVAAHHRGVDVKLIADREQTKIMRRGQVPAIAAAGIPVWLDGEHLSAHDKVMIIDAGTKQAAVITGSYNFTKAAQYRNAENVLIVHGNQALATAYRVNWQQHLPHAQAFGVNDSNHRNHK